MEEGSGAINLQLYWPSVSCIIVNLCAVAFGVQLVKRLTIYKTNCTVLEEAMEFDRLFFWSPNTISIFDS